MKWCWCVLILSGLVVPVPGEVATSSANGFNVTIQVQIDAPPARAYEAVVEEVGVWWDPAHSFYGRAENLSIDDRPGGCFCERSDKGQVRHMTVIFASPGKTLRLTGGLGPLQEMGVVGNMGFQFSEAEGGTRLEFYYAVGGYASGGLDQLAPVVDTVLSGQLKRLESYLETGSPTSP